MTGNGPPLIFSNRRRAAKWPRLLARQSSPHAARYLLQDTLDDVQERIEFMQLSPGKVLLIGDWSGQLQHYFAEAGAVVDSFAIGECAEEHPFGIARYDLIVQILGLGSVNDLPGALIHSRNALTAEGVFIASFPGAGSLPQLRSIMLHADGERPAARIHPMVDQRAAADLLQRASFSRQVVDSHTLSVRFSSFDRLISDLRDHGLTNCLHQPALPLSKAQFSRAQAAFEAMADPDGKVTERFEMLTLTGWK